MNYNCYSSSSEDEKSGRVEPGSSFASGSKEIRRSRGVVWSDWRDPQQPSSSSSSSSSTFSTAVTATQLLNQFPRPGQPLTPILEEELLKNNTSTVRDCDLKKIKDDNLGDLFPFSYTLIPPINYSACYPCPCQAETSPGIDISSSASALFYTVPPKKPGTSSGKKATEILGNPSILKPFRQLEEPTRFLNGPGVRRRKWERSSNITTVTTTATVPQSSNRPVATTRTTTRRLSTPNNNNSEATTAVSFSSTSLRASVHSSRASSQHSDGSRSVSRQSSVSELSAVQQKLSIESPSRMPLRVRMRRDEYYYTETSTKATQTDEMELSNNEKSASVSRESSGRTTSGRRLVKVDTVDRSTSPIRASSSSSGHYLQKLEDLEKITGHFVIQRFFTRSENEFTTWLEQQLASKSAEGGTIKGSSSGKTQPPPTPSETETVPLSTQTEEWTGAVTKQSSVVTEPEEVATVGNDKKQSSVVTPPEVATAVGNGNNNVDTPGPPVTPRITDVQRPAEIDRIDQVLAEVEAQVIPMTAAAEQQSMDAKVASNTTQQVEADKKDGPVTAKVAEENKSTTADAVPKVPTRPSTAKKVEQISAAQVTYETTAAVAPVTTDGAQIKPESKPEIDSTAAASTPETPESKSAASSAAAEGIQEIPERESAASAMPPAPKPELKRSPTFDVQESTRLPATGETQTDNNAAKIEQSLKIEPKPTSASPPASPTTFNANEIKDQVTAPIPPQESAQKSKVTTESAKSDAKTVEKTDAATLNSKVQATVDTKSSTATTADQPTKPDQTKAELKPDSTAPTPSPPPSSPKPEPEPMKSKPASPKDTTKTQMKAVMTTREVTVILERPPTAKKESSERKCLVTDLIPCECFAQHFLQEESIAKLLISLSPRTSTPITPTSPPSQPSTKLDPVETFEKFEAELKPSGVKSQPEYRTLKHSESFSYGPVTVMNAESHCQELPSFVFPHPGVHRIKKSTSIDSCLGSESVKTTDSRFMEEKIADNLNVSQDSHSQNFEDFKASVEEEVISKDSGLGGVISGRSNWYQERSSEQRSQGSGNRRTQQTAVASSSVDMKQKEVFSAESDTESEIIISENYHARSEAETDTEATTDGDAMADNLCAPNPLGNRHGNGEDTDDDELDGKNDLMARMELDELRLEIEKPLGMTIRNTCTQTNRSLFSSAWSDATTTSSSTTNGSESSCIDLEVVSKKFCSVPSAEGNRRHYLPSSSSSLNFVNCNMNFSVRGDESKFKMSVSLPGIRNTKVGMKGGGRAGEGQRKFQVAKTPTAGSQNERDLPSLWAHVRNRLDSKVSVDLPAEENKLPVQSGGGGAGDAGVGPSSKQMTATLSEVSKDGRRRGERPQHHPHHRHFLRTQNNTDDRIKRSLERLSKLLDIDK